MEVSFRTKKLQKQCNKYKKCVRTYGQICADKIQARLDELADSPNLKCMELFPQARLHPLKGDRNGHYALDVKHPKRLIIEPNHNPLPELPTGGIDLEEVTRVVVIEVEDYH